jgi:hypothetical protein
MSRNYPQRRPYNRRRLRDLSVRIFLVYAEAKVKGDVCCVGPDSTDELYYECSIYDGKPCGRFRGYGQVWSKCCIGDNGLLAVLVCDQDGAGLTHVPCKSPYTCVQHKAIFGGGEPFAQCERVDL